MDQNELDILGYVMLLMDLGSFIRDQRIKNNWSQMELAKLMHKRQATISDWENGKTDISLLTLVRLLNVFGVECLEIKTFPPAKKG